MLNMDLGGLSQKQTDQVKDLLVNRLCLKKKVLNYLQIIVPDLAF